MLEKTGIASASQIESVFPGIERLAKGPVAVIECFQKIPCNPCAMACKRGAIQPFEDINNLPVLDFEKCNGCSLCVSKCPGLSIMVVDMTYSNEEASVKIPYEFLPLPVGGETVQALNRSGEVIGLCRVLSVQNSPALDKTPIVSVALDKNSVKEFRNIRVVR